MSTTTTSMVMESILTPARDLDAYLASYLQALPLPPALVAAIEYAVMSGGKRLRPVLAWHACEAVGAAGAHSLPAGAAVELVHTFSLVHDDLPAMDDDDLRRGRPTLHKHAGEAMAILAGDSMLALAFELLGERTSPELAGILGLELARGTNGMIAGQVFDTLGGLPAGRSPLDHVRMIHERKTAALLRAAARMGALCGLRARGLTGAAASGALECIDQYGTAIGLMFQVIDDLMDVEQTTEHTGKRTGKDQAGGKLTYPGVVGVEGSREEVARLQERALRAIAPLGPRAEALRSLCAFMSTRTQ